MLAGLAVVMMAGMNGTNANAILNAVLTAERTETMQPDEVDIWRSALPTGFALATQQAEESEELVARAVMYADSIVVVYREARRLNDRVGVCAMSDSTLAAVAEQVQALTPTPETVEQMVARVTASGKR